MFVSPISKNHSVATEYYVARPARHVSALVTYRIPGIGFSDTPGISRKIGFRQVEQCCSLFFANFYLAYLMLFQSGVHTPKL